MGHTKGRLKYAYMAVFFFATSFIPLFMTSAEVHASMQSTTGRAANRGFFTNTYYKGYGKKLLSDGVFIEPVNADGSPAWGRFGAGIRADNYQAKVSRLMMVLRDTAKGGTKYSARQFAVGQNKTAAGFIVNTMLGVKGSDAKREVGEAQLTELEKRLNYFIGKGGGTIKREKYAYDVNTMYVHKRGINDVVWYNNKGSQYSYVFRDGDGKIKYILKENCANPLGGLVPDVPTTTIITTPEDKDPIVSALDLSCSGILRGVAYDPDDMYEHVWLEIYDRPRTAAGMLDGSQGRLNTAPGGTQANLQEIAFGTNRAHRHAFEFDITKGYPPRGTPAKDMTETHRIYVYALGIEKGGAVTKPMVWATGVIEGGGDHCRRYQIITETSSTADNIPIGNPTDITFNHKMIKKPREGKITDISDAPHANPYYAVKQYIVRADGQGVDLSAWNDSTLDPNGQSTRVGDERDLVLTAGDIFDPTTGTQIDASDIPNFDCRFANIVNLFRQGPKDPTTGQYPLLPVTDGKCKNIIVTIDTGKIDLASTLNNGPPNTNIEHSFTSTMTVEQQRAAGLRPGDQVCRHLAVDRASDTLSERHRISKPVCITVSKTPSMMVTGGDVAVGRSSGSTAMIGTKHNTISIGGQSAYYGSWLEYSGRAPGSIKTFTGASMLPVGGGDARSMSFANTFNDVNQAGSFGATGIAQYTYGDDVIAAGATNMPRSAMSGSTIDVARLAAGRYYYTSNASVNIRGQARAGVTLVVKAADITVNGNLQYADGPYSNPKDVPAVILQASRNISVDQSVSRIDGWLIAQGAISTCGSPIVASKNYYEGLSVNTCNSQLRLNGAIVADKLQLRRTFGAEARLDTTSLSAVRGDLMRSAEHINHRADTLLWQLGQRQGGSNYSTQSIQELPPRF